VDPLTPYGSSKLMCERILHDAAAAHPGFIPVSLRYFNVAGADPDGRLGNTAPDATHLIKVACLTALGVRSVLQVYGTDYSTPDGTCVRDYVHVSDLADVHVTMLRHLERGGRSGVFNCDMAGASASARLWTPCKK
jgi:UDP-glucose 4-epimerase